MEPQNSSVVPHLAGTPAETSSLQVHLQTSDVVDVLVVESELQIANRIEEFDAEIQKLAKALNVAGERVSVRRKAQAEATRKRVYRLLRSTLAAEGLKISELRVSADAGSVEAAITIETPEAPGIEQFTGAHAQINRKLQTNQELRGKLLALKNDPDKLRRNISAALTRRKLLDTPGVSKLVAATEEALKSKVLALPDVVRG